MSEEARRVVENTIPVLAVSDVQRSARFYTETLGFAPDWSVPDGRICSVSRDGCRLMLEYRPVPSQGTVWIGLVDESLIDLCMAERVRVVQEPQNASYAYHGKFADPDGNVLWLGAEPRS